jgi:predicted CoA-binding protein
MDGSTATVRIATGHDAEALASFFARLSVESLRARFLSQSIPGPQFVESLCDSSNPRVQLTLVVERLLQSDKAIVAVGSYFGRNNDSAEVAMAVDDQFQRKGIGSALLERLALLATRAGFTRFWAITRMENRDMIDVFRNSGFPLEDKAEGGIVELDFSVLPTETSVQSSEIRDRVATAASLTTFFKPKTVAVVGASREPSSIGFRILRALVENRYQGRVFPVNPNAAVIASLRVFPTVSAIGERVDLAVIAVPANVIPGVLDDCARAGVKSVIVITAGFAESGEKAGNCRINCSRGFGVTVCA